MSVTNKSRAKNKNGGRGGGGNTNGNGANKKPIPSAQDIIVLAESVGYSQYRSEVSKTLYFISEGDDENSKSAVKINVYYTTRSVMTHLNHPSEAGLNQLWRSHAYDTLDELREIFENPRKHTGKGYRNAQKAVRGCVKCGLMKKRSDFSINQWAKGPDGNLCRACTGGNGNGSVKQEPDDLESITRSFEDVGLTDEDSGDDGDDGGDFPRLTAESLSAHEKEIGKKKIRKDLERRQFNCPECPKRGRGNYAFYKKVPKLKPVIKCPQCKKASGGRCKRLYPIARKDERGYGLFNCRKCGDKWGSSRAVHGIAQNCFKCADKGVDSTSTPFRMEVFKKRKGSKRMQRKPREPIGEDEEDNRGYSQADHQRHEDGASNALVKGRSDNGFYRGGYVSDVTSSQYGSEQSYEYVPRATLSGDSSDDSVATPAPKTTPVGMSRIPKNYVHKCAGCARGLCKSRKIPKSEMHDVSDGNTVSTSSSIMTNSSVDKAEYVDRDEDFSGLDEISDSGSWIGV